MNLIVDGTPALRGSIVNQAGVPRPMQKNIRLKAVMQPAPRVTRLKGTGDAMAEGEAAAEEDVTTLNKNGENPFQRRL